MIPMTPNLASVESRAESSPSSSRAPATGRTSEDSIQAPIAAANGASCERSARQTPTPLIFLRNWSSRSPRFRIGGDLEEERFGRKKMGGLREEEKWIGLRDKGIIGGNRSVVWNPKSPTLEVGEGDRWAKDGGHWQFQSSSCSSCFVRLGKRTRHCRLPRSDAGDWWAKSAFHVFLFALP